MLTLPFLALGLALGAEAKPTDAPLFRLEAGTSFAWRSDTVAPDSGTALEYRTDRPYLGLALRLEFDPSGPLGRALAPDAPGLLRNMAEHLGLEVRYEQGWLHTHLVDASGEILQLGSTERRASLDLLYRMALGLGLPAGAAELRARLGAGLQRFTLGQQAEGLESSRWSLRLGAEVIQPVVPAAGRPSPLAVRAEVTILPFAGPGEAQRESHGSGGSGWGLESSIGVEGALDRLFRGLGWRLRFDSTYYRDHYSGPGLMSRGGVAAEWYLRTIAAATYAW